MYINNIHKCCEHCSNNPKNNPYASGICWCALPAMEMQTPQNIGDYFYGHPTTSHKFEFMFNPLVNPILKEYYYGLYG